MQVAEQQAATLPDPKDLADQIMSRVQTYLDQTDPSQIDEKALNHLISMHDHLLQQNR